MLKKLISIGSLGFLLSLVSTAGAQALPTAVAKGSLQIGFGYSYARPDYGQFAIQGVSAFADFDVSQHLGVEADVHYIALNTPTDLAENTYLVGPRFLYPHGRVRVYAKGLLGIGSLVIQQADNLNRTPGTDFAYALGGGLDIVATKHIVVRAIDFEYQHWNYQTGLTPMAFTAGVAYRFR
jgi:hypothetical protein